MDSSTVIILAGIVSGIVLLSLKLCYKSKCQHISILYGLITVDRSVLTESKNEVGEDIEQANPSTSITLNTNPSTVSL